MVARDNQTGRDQGVDLTPMLDVVFILLIFFIVAATFVRESGLDANPPDRERHAPATQESIMVHISGQDGFTIGRRHVDRRALRATFERLHAELPEAPVIIQAHRDSSAAALVFVMDQSRLAGVTNVSLAAK